MEINGKEMGMTQFAQLVAKHLAAQKVLTTRLGPGADFHVFSGVRDVTTHSQLRLALVN